MSRNDMQFLCIYWPESSKSTGCKKLTSSLEGIDHSEPDPLRWINYFFWRGGVLCQSYIIWCYSGSFKSVGYYSAYWGTQKAMGSRYPKRVLYVKCLIYTPSKILITKQELTHSDMSFPFHLVEASPKIIQSLLLRRSSFRNNISWANVVLIKLMG